MTLVSGYDDFYKSIYIIFVKLSDWSYNMWYTNHPLLERYILRQQHHIFRSEKRIMMRFNQDVFYPYLTFLVILAITPSLMEGFLVEQKYKLMFSKCTFTDAFNNTLAPSLITCARFCTHSSTCKSFAWRPGQCWLFSFCPQSCNESALGEEGWNIYCLDGKVHFAWKNDNTFL